MDPVYISRIAEFLEALSMAKRRKVTTDELADYVGVSRQTIHNWSSYRGVDRLPSADHMARLCQFLGKREWEIWRLVSEDPVGEKSPGNPVGVVAALA